MKKQLQGISLILFGLLLNGAGTTLNKSIFASFGGLPFALISVIIGIVGLVVAFKKENDE